MKTFTVSVTKVFFTCLLWSSAAIAQQKNPFNLPNGLPVPFWVSETNWQHPNIHSVDSMIEVYRNTAGRDKEQIKHLPGNAAERDEESFREDPYTNAYIRWRNKMAPFVQPDGTVLYDQEYAKNELLRSIEALQTKVNGSGMKKTTGPANWTILGPVETYSAPSGTKENHQANIYCMAVAPSNPSVLYAGSEPGTLFRSADKGLHWVSVSDGLSGISTNSIVVDPVNENVVYVYDGSANTLLKTIDGGVTWAALSGFTGGTGNALAINHNTGRVLITGTASVYYSDNGGTTWSPATGSTVTGQLYDLAISPTGTDTVYAVGSTSGNLVVLLRSVDGGATFANVSGTLATENTDGARLGVTMANPDYVYCINIGSTSSPKLFKSTDRGASWGITVASTATGLAGSSATTGLGMSDGQGFYDLSIIVSQTNASAVIVGSTTMYKSTDGGFNFSPLGGYHGSFGLHPDMQHAVTIGTDAYITTDGGVNYSTDFFTNLSNWSVRNYGLRSSDFWGFGQGWDEDIVVGGRYHNGNTAISETYTGGRSLSLGGGEDATGHVFHGRSRTAGFRDIGTLVLPETLTGAVQYGAPDVPNSLWPQDDYYGLFSSKLVVDPRYSNVFYAGKDSILWKSTNSGASYAALHNFGNGNKVWRFEISRSNPSVIYVCATSGIYKSSNAGATWTSLSLGVTYSSYNADISVNPLNENEVYVCMANAIAANKVFRSRNGGATFTNITGSLSGKHVAYLQFQGGTNSGVYAITNAAPSKVYYRDSTMSDWTDFSTGLPQSLQARVGALIFYRDSKLRLGGNCGIWETPLYSTGAPVAQPMADRKYVGCTRDTVNFFDYSICDYAGATRLWSFPGASWVSSTTAATPKVLYPGPGSYSVSLQITNSLGQTHTKTVDSMITVTDDHCVPDTVAGLCLKMNGTSQTVNLGIADIHSNNFSISCWVQPNGNQSSFSQIISHDSYPGSGGYGLSFGFTFNGYTPNLKLCYTDSLVNYSNSSSLVCDSTKWNFVVLTYSPTGVTMYLNGVADVVNSTSPMPVIDLSQSPFMVNFDDHQGQGSAFNGKIDEVKFYNYALSQNEVREKMHLITDPTTETGLIKYFQFNQYDPLSGNLYDVKANFSSSVPAANIVSSSAPVGTGRVARIPAVSSAGPTVFTAPNVDLYLPAGGVYPEGEVVAFHLFCAPDTKPDIRPTVPGYFILNNYGANSVFTQPDSVMLGGLNIPYSGYAPGNFKLFRRSTGDFGNSWAPELDSAAVFNFAPLNSSLTWTANNHITFLNIQFLIINNDSSTLQSAVVRPKNKWLISDVYPNPGNEFCKIDIYAPDILPHDAKLVLTNTQGEEVLRISERISKGENTLMLMLPKLTPGTYFLKVTLGTEVSETRKLLID